MTDINASRAVLAEARALIGEGDERRTVSFRPRISTGSYEKWRFSTLGEITEALEDGLLFELLGDVAGLRVLDVGCGDGTFALKLHAQGAEVFGVDPDTAMIDAARRRFRCAGVTIPLAVAEGEHLPFADATFDAVMAKTVLCFVTEAAAMVDEMARVLRRDGRFVIGELGRWSLWAAQRRMRGWLGSSLWRHGRFRTPDELRGLAASAGLTVHQIRGAVYYPRATWAARLLAPRDAWFGHLTTFGAAFLALSATKSGGDVGSPQAWPPRSPHHFMALPPCTVGESLSSL